MQLIKKVKQGLFLENRKGLVYSSASRSSWLKILFFVLLLRQALFVITL